MTITADEISWDLAPAEETSIPTEDDLLGIAIVEAQSYRLFAQLALHALHEITIQRDVLRDQRQLDRRRQREARW